MLCPSILTGRKAASSPLNHYDTLECPFHILHHDSICDPDYVQNVLAFLAISSGDEKVAMSPSMTSNPVWSFRTQGA